MLKRIVKIISIIMIYGLATSLLSMAAIELKKEYKIDEDKKYIYRILPKTTAKEFKEGFDIDSKNIQIQDLKDADIIKTRTKTTFTDGKNTNEYSISVIGDVNDNGLSDKEDTSLMANHIIENSKLSDLETLSADVNRDGEVNQIDLFLQIKYITEGELYIPEVRRPSAPIITLKEGRIGENDFYVNNVELLIEEAKNSEVEIAKTVYKFEGETEEHQINKSETIRLNKNGTYTILSYSYSKEGTKSEIARKTIKLDKTGPTTTAPSVIEKDTAKIKIKLEQIEEEGEIVEAYCRIRETGTDWKAWQTSEVFENLKPNTTYEIQTKCKNSAGLETESDLLTTTTKDITVPTIQVDNLEKWTTSKNVSITGSEEFDLYVQLGNDEAEKQANYVTTKEINKNIVITAYCVDYSGNLGRETTVNIRTIDDKDPIITNVVATKTVTTSEIEVAADISDSNVNGEDGSGIKSVTYSIKKSSDADYDVSNQKVYNTIPESHTFDSLKNNQEYNIKIEVEDDVGKIVSWTGNARTTDLAEITLSIENETTWTASKKVTASGEITSTDYIEMSTDGWTTSSKTSNLNITKNNTIIYARVVDKAGNKKEAASKKVTKIDTTAPTNSAPTLSAKTTNSITINFTQTDTDSGLSGGNSYRQYRIKKSSGTYGGWTSFSGSTATISGLDEKTDYVIQTRAADFVGNVSEPGTSYTFGQKTHGTYTLKTISGTNIASTTNMGTTAAGTNTKSVTSGTSVTISCTPTNTSSWSPSDLPANESNNGKTKTYTSRVYKFSGWSDSSTVQSRSFIMPENDVILTATGANPTATTTTYKCIQYGHPEKWSTKPTGTIQYWFYMITFNNSLVWGNWDTLSRGQDLALSDWNVLKDYKWTGMNHTWHWSIYDTASGVTIRFDRGGENTKLPKNRQFGFAIATDEGQKSAGYVTDSDPNYVGWITVDTKGWKTQEDTRTWAWEVQ